MFSGEKTQAFVQVIVTMFTQVMDAFELALTSSAGDKAALQEAKSKIEELTTQLEDIDGSVSSELLTALTPVIERAQSLTTVASEATPPTDIPVE